MSRRYPLFFLLFPLIAVLHFGCVQATVPPAKSPTVAQAQAVPALGAKARIAVAQIVNNTGGLEAQLQRVSMETQARMVNLSRDMMEFQKKMIPYQAALMAWQSKVASVGEKNAGPPPKAPEFSSASSAYMSTVTDPVAGGLRDMMVNALFNCGRFIVVERQALDKISFEQEFSQSGRVGAQTKIPIGQIEGAELLILGSLNTLDAQGSGGDLGAMASLFFPQLTQSTLGNSALNVTWKTAKAAMEVRVVDTRTSRVVAAATVNGSATSFGSSGGNKDEYTNAPLPASFSAFQNTPVESAFRKMVKETVNFLVKKTPENYFHAVAK
jgi:curli biogenesis system outer membrane secretion channel CsgG